MYNNGLKFGQNQNDANNLLVKKERKKRVFTEVDMIVKYRNDKYEMREVFSQTATTARRLLVHVFTQSIARDYTIQPI